jgi:hypothetical protein
MGVFREFFLIVAGGFIGSALGTAFGALVAVLFPDFVELLWRPDPVGPAVPLGAAMGMVFGLPIGAAAMAAGRLIGAARARAGLRDGMAGQAEPSAASGPQGTQAFRNS